MKTNLLLPVLLLAAALPAQQPAPNAPPEKGATPLATHRSSLIAHHSTRAVVIGISDYQDPAIPDLRFAHRDAEAFAQWLHASQGLEGSMPGEDRIKVLINEQATAGRVAGALDALIEQTREGEQVIIYFSGHGDVERKTVSQPGYLLCWDASSRVYMSGGAFSLAHLEDVVSTLSTENKARVILIADACHAGKLAGSRIGGAQLTAASLAQQFENEIRILSCQPSEFSLEGVQWGDGRGVFSYHLVDGLAGLADRNADQSVTLSEIIRYLEDRVPAEVAPQSQIPLAVGNRSEQLAKVDARILAEIQQFKKGGMPAFAPVESKGLEDEILTRADSGVRAMYTAFKLAVQERRFFPAPVQSGEPAGPESSGCAEDYYTVLQQLEALAPLQGAMKRNYAAALQDDAQQVLNSFLKTDMNEITRTRLKKIQKYRPYPALLERAAQLLGPDHYFYPELMSRKNIFEGILAHLQAPRLNDRETGNNILRYYREALRWQPDNPLTFNFIGRVYSIFMADLDSAEYFTRRAGEFAPTWVLPMGTFAFELTTRFYKYERAKQWLDKALAIDSSSAYLFNQYGIWCAENRRLQEADSLFRKALTYDSTNTWYYGNYAFNCERMGKFRESVRAHLHTIRLDSTILSPYTNLGNLYVRTGEYENAERWYKKAIAVDSFCSLCYSGLGILYANTNRTDEAIAPLFKATETDPANLYAWGTLGNLYLGKKDYPAAIEAYRGVLRVDSATRLATLAYSGIGTALERTGKTDEAIAACRRSVELDSTNIWAMCCWARALLKKGAMAEAAAMLDRANAVNATDWVAYHFVLLDAQTGYHARALERLEPLLTKIPILDYEELQSEPLLAPLRNLPEWQAFMKKHFPEGAKK